MKKVIIDNIRYVPITSKEKLIESLKQLINFKTGDGNGHPITSEELKENEKYYGLIEKGLPFFCEATLYTLMGKQDARTLLGSLFRLGKECGVDVEELFEDVK